MMLHPALPVFLCALFCCGVMLACPAMAATDVNKPVPTAADKNQNTIIQAWDLFTEGCLRSNDDIERWANQFDVLAPADFVDPDNLPEMARSLGYPGPDRTVAAWALKDSRTMMMVQENKGCSVSLDQFIAPDVLSRMVKELAGDIEAGTKTATSLERKMGTKGQYMYLIKSAAQRGKSRDGNRYMLFVTSPDSQNKSVRTVMHSFRSSSDFKL